MQTQQINILDLLTKSSNGLDLLGGITPKGQTDGLHDGSQGGFNELMLSLLGIAGDNQLLAINNEEAQSANSQFFSLLGDAEGIAAGNGLMNQTGLTDGESVDGTLSVLDKEGKIQRFNADLQELGLLKGTSQPLMKEVLPELPMGEYQITDVKIEDNKITLSLLNADNEELFVTIPQHLLEQLSSNGRVSVDNIFAQQSNLKELAQNLKLKELIVTENTATNEVTLAVADSVDEAAEVLAILPQNNLRVVRQQQVELNQKQTTEDMLTDADDSAQSIIKADESAKASIVKPQTLQFRQLSMMNQSIEEQIMLNGDKKSSKELLDAMTNPVDSKYPTEQLTTLANARGGNQTAPIKFTMPEDIQNSLRPNGQSVLLRIEPDNLGPAKLSLSMSNDKLRARLVVNSTLAKSMIEGSLDKLVDQLEKANIKVDMIDVQVADDQTGQGLFDRQAYRPRKMTNRFLGMNDINNNDVEPVSPVASRMQSQYVGAGGVNMLA